jgi:hypothetical protein
MKLACAYVVLAGLVGCGADAADTPGTARRYAIVHFENLGRCNTGLCEVKLTATFKDDGGRDVAQATTRVVRDRGADGDAAVSAPLPEGPLPTRVVLSVQTGLFRSPRGKAGDELGFYQHDVANQSNWLNLEKVLQTSGDISPAAYEAEPAVLHIGIDVAAGSLKVGAHRVRHRRALIDRGARPRLQRASVARLRGTSGRERRRS